MADESEEKVAFVASVGGIEVAVVEWVWVHSSKVLVHNKS